MNLPARFVSNVTQAYPQGQAWLYRLPALLEEAAGRWQLTLGAPFLLSYNYVCAATDPSGSPLVLKVGVPNVELSSEIQALQYYAGVGACRCLAADAQHGMLLLERLLPGTMLTDVKDEDQAVRIAARLITQMHSPPASAAGFLSLRAWFDGMRSLRPRFNGGTGPFPEGAVATVEGILAELMQEDRPEVLLHGDFHHYNILLSQRGWLVIDPKGVIGVAEYETAPYLLNPLERPASDVQAMRRTRRRIDLFAEVLGWEPRRIWRWGLCHSLLSAWWDLADDGAGAAPWLEIFLRLQSVYDQG